MLRLAALATLVATSGSLLVACTATAGDGDGTCEPDEQDCGGSTGGKADGVTAANRAQMNDLTIVMPLPTTQSEVDAMIPASKLLPKALYTSKFPDQGSTGVGADVGMVYAHLRVVAIRFDPCFANIGPVTDASTCDNQIRVIFQSLTPGNAVDGAVHAFFRVSRDELASTIQEVVALRRANGQTHTMGPLAPHPLIERQGETGAFAVGLAKILAEHASPTNLIRFTHFQSGNLQTTWSFAGFDVDGADVVSTAKLSAMVIPTLPADATGVSFFTGFSANLSGGFTPETTSDDDIALFANGDNAKAASKTAQQKTFDATLRIENPDFHSPNTIDCASCHVAQEVRMRVGTTLLGLSAADNDNAFAQDPKYVSKTNMKQTTKDKSFNVHMLSYRNDTLMIAQRVINETAATVAYVNSEVL